MDVFLMGNQKGLLILKCKLSKPDCQELTDKSVFRQLLIFQLLTF